MRCFYWPFLNWSADSHFNWKWFLLIKDTWVFFFICVHVYVDISFWALGFAAEIQFGQVYFWGVLVYLRSLHHSFWDYSCGWPQSRATIVKGDQNVLFVIATPSPTPRFKGRAQLLALESSTLPSIQTLYCWVLSKEDHWRTLYPLDQF